MAMMLMTQTALLARSGQQGMAPQQQGMTGDTPCPSPMHVHKTLSLHTMTAEDKVHQGYLRSVSTYACICFERTLLSESIYQTSMLVALQRACFVSLLRQPLL